MYFMNIFRYFAFLFIFTQPHVASEDRRVHPQPILADRSTRDQSAALTFEEEMRRGWDEAKRRFSVDGGGRFSSSHVSRDGIAGSEAAASDAASDAKVPASSLSIAHALHARGGKRVERAAVFDGGGVRGAFSAEVYRSLLRYLNSGGAESSDSASAASASGDAKATPRIPTSAAGETTDVFDVFSGTSTGSLIALASALPYHPRLTDEGDVYLDSGKPVFDKGPYSPTDIVKLYQRLSSQIFVTTYMGSRSCSKCCQPDECADTLCSGLWDMTVGMLRLGYCTGGTCAPCRCSKAGTCCGWCGPIYSNEKFRNLLSVYFGDTRFRDLAKNAIIVATNINTRSAEYFSKIRTPNMLIADAAWASTAAQTYFPPVLVKKNPREVSAAVRADGHDEQIVACADGGVTDNSPITAVVYEILAENEGCIPGNFLIASFGTGKLPEQDRYSGLRSRGCLGWLKELPPQSIESTASAGLILLQDLSRKLYGDEDRIFKFELLLTQEFERIDDPNNIPGLLVKAEEYMESEAGKKLAGSFAKRFYGEEFADDALDMGDEHSAVPAAAGSPAAAAAHLGAAAAGLSQAVGASP